jgi:hypothetical protein
MHKCGHAVFNSGACPTHTLTWKALLPAYANPSHLHKINSRSTYRRRGIWISCMVIWGWRMCFRMILCTVFVIRSCLMLGKFGMTLLRGAARGWIKRERLCSQFLQRGTSKSPWLESILGHCQGLTASLGRESVALVCIHGPILAIWAS